MLFTQTPLDDAVFVGHHGKPENYPFIEDYDDLLFYIQRNQNLNSVVYEVNLLPGNLLNLTQPIKIHWLKYNEDASTEKHALNVIQQKLAYGYQHRTITNELIEFRFVSYEEMKFYIAKNENGRFRVFSVIDGVNIEILSMYIYAEDFGVFPQVKFVEFFGKNTCTADIFYKKLILE